MNKHLLFLSIFIVFLFSLVLWQNFSQTTAQHFSLMAESFIHGRLDLMRLDPETGNLDIFFQDGKAHWANFPFPGVILIPFVFIFQKLGLFFYQGYLQFFITAGIFYLSYLLAQKFKFNKINSLYLAIAMCFASNYSFVAFYTGSWYYSQPVNVILLLLAFYEWYTKRRLLLVGVILGCLLATRATAGIGAIFFGLQILFEKRIDLREKIGKLVTLSLPIVISVILLMAYNQARFGSPWETGYSDDNISPEFQVVMLKRHGLFKLENIPTNMYWNFIAPPDPVLEDFTYHLKFPFLRPNSLGMSFFIMSPIFLWIFKTLKKPTHEQKLLWISLILILIPLLMWYSTGFWQIGARYMLDLIGFAFILLLMSFEKSQLKYNEKLIIIVSSLTNLFFILPLLISNRW